MPEKCTACCKKVHRSFCSIRFRKKEATAKRATDAINDDKHLLAFRIGPETLAGAEPHSGRLSLFIGYVMKRLIETALVFVLSPRSVPQVYNTETHKKFHCLPHKPPLNVNQRNISKEIKINSLEAEPTRSTMNICSSWR